MGGVLSCAEGATWDSHARVHHHYKPAEEPPQDMTQPLSHYFISSGHNSYLDGNQLTSAAGTKTIEEGLKRGCRVIELDVYDGPSGTPVVTHGGTLTSTATFAECIKAVSRHAFSASPFPVILTIENHTGQAQQAQMAAELRHVFGAHLFVPSPEQMAPGAAWLSPQELRSKVVVRMKVKPDTVPELAALVYIRNTSIKGYDAAAARSSAPSSHSLPDSKLPSPPEYALYAGKTAVTEKTIAESISSIKASLMTAWRSSRGSSGTGTASASGAGDAQAQVRQAAPPPAIKARVAAAVAANGSAANGPDAEAAAAAAEELQLAAEQDDTLDSPTAADACSSGGAEAAAAANDSSSLPSSLTSPPLASVFGYTSRQLLRCYPSGWHMVGNTNPNPCNAWSLGMSLAALNWQLWDEPMWTNDAFFSRFNNCGYVLKPPFMTAPCPGSALPERQPRTLAVTVYSAHKHQGRRVGVIKDDPYVELKVVGLPVDTGAVRTEHAKDTGRLIVDKTFTLPVAFPELAVLLVLLKDADVGGTTDSVLGYSSLPLASLAPGDYMLRLTKPYVLPRKDHEHMHVTSMWVKVKLEWLEGAAGGAEQAQGGTAAAAT